MNYKDLKLSEEAIAYVKANRVIIVEKFCDPNKFTPVEHPVSIFMAGSPGAGKTEFSKELLEIFSEQYREAIVRIDADEIRNILPQYAGGNAHLFQGACSIGVDYIYNHALKCKQNVIVDGTLANYEKAYTNISRSIKRNRFSMIFYVYQEPHVAWEFTQKREKLEGRNIPKQAFIAAFLNARYNADRIKGEFHGDIVLNFVQKNYQNRVRDFRHDVENIDNHLKTNYTKEELYKIL